MAFAKSVFAVAAHLLLSSSMSNAVKPPCECEASWSSPTAGCSDGEFLCPIAACDGISKPWCKVANKGCAEESADEGWAWCDNATGKGIDLNPAYDGQFSKECMDVTTYDTDADLKCYRAVTWAMNVGIVGETTKKYYENYSLTKDSSRLDFQCALADMVGPEEKGTGHGCPVPCNSTLSQCNNAGSVADKDMFSSTNVTTTTIITTTTAASGSSSSFPLFAWILTVLAVLAIAAGLAYYFFGMKKEAPKKKKRAVKKATPAPAAAPVAAPAPAPATTPSVITAPPVYITSPAPAAAPMMVSPSQTSLVAAPMAAPMEYMVAPTEYMAAPQMAYAQPTAYAQPVQYASPVQSMAMPVQAMAVPIQQATPMYAQTASLV